MPTDSAPVHRFREAYDRHLPAMKALAPSAVLAVNIDIPAAGTTALGVVPKLKAYREFLLALPATPAASIEELESLAMAMLHSHAEWAAATTP